MGVTAQDLVQLTEEPFEAPAQAIAALSVALAAEPGLTEWSAAADRAVVRARLRLRLGDEYFKRRESDRADNLERALTAYTDALADIGDQEPVLRAQAHHCLARLYAFRVRGERADNIEQAIAFGEAALTLRTRETFPTDWAATNNNLGIAYHERIRGERADNIDRAIAFFEAALTVYTREFAPGTWAVMQNNLANVYNSRIHGERADNIERAIALFEATLSVLTRDAAPFDWATVQHNLANAYAERIRGGRADNLDRSIALLEAALTVYTREAFPDKWASTQHSLGTTYEDRVYGDRADNIERAIALYEAALTVRTREALPMDWAATQNNLAIAYGQRIRGEKADNIERSIAHSEAALSVYTREAFPASWGLTCTNLAAAYKMRVHGARADNIERAISHYESVLTLLTREAFPEKWASTQVNLANAYRDRGGRGRSDNIERAIALYEAALNVRTRDAFPVDWALTLDNLAAAYGNRTRGERADNIDKAIALLEAALTVRTPEALPVEAAATQHNLAVVYAARQRGQQADNLARAIALCEAALTVRMRETSPLAHLETANLLGQVLGKTHDWPRAATVLADARATFALLFGQGLDEAEASGLIEMAGSLFANAAYTACQLGSLGDGFDLACQSRARMLATALRLQTLAIPPPQRQRLEAVRTAIREQSRLLEQASAAARNSVINQLRALRLELTELIAPTETSEVDGDALALAGPLVADGGAVILPMATEFGGKMFVITAAHKRPKLTVCDLPDLTSDQLKILVSNDDSSSWLSAFASDLPLPERKARTRHLVESIGGKLWRLLAASLQTALVECGIKRGARLMLLPSGSLGFLPLGLAQEPLSGRRLMEDYEIVHSPSLEALRKAHGQVAQPPAASLAAIVNPTGDLLFTPIEGEWVASEFAAGSRVVLDQRTATLEAALATLKGRAYWHFATHGTFHLEEARHSALMLSGGTKLSVGTLLEAEDLGQPRLVVLSACESGLHDIERTPEEFVGFPGAFMTLGAAAVLATLWPVDDHAATLLTARFYELHRRHGEPPASALRRAQLWLRDATRAELAAYAETAVAEHRLTPESARLLEAALADTSVSAEAVRFFDNAAAEPPRALRDGTPRDEHPFAHPVYWGGFVLSGL